MLPELPDPSQFDEARAALLSHRDKALAGLRWEEDGPLSIVVWLPAEDPKGDVDVLLSRMTFLYYPTYPPSVTFLNPTTREYDGFHWPRVTGAPRIAFYPRYGDAPFGMVCNSMVFEWYFWGGHNTNSQAVTWEAGHHTMMATVTEILDALKPPYYQGKS